MIIPAAAYRIAGFLDNKGKIRDTVQEGGLVFCYNDTGKPIVVKMTGDKKLTQLDIQSYFEAKKSANVKENELSNIIGELNMSESFQQKLAEFEAQIREKNPQIDFKAIIDQKMKFTQKYAKEIIDKRNGIRQGSIIKTTLSYKDNSNIPTFHIFNQNVPFLDARSILFDQTGEPSKHGLYYYSMRNNSLPVELKPVFNKENVFTGLFKVSISKMITFSQFKYFMGHAKRTALRAMESEKFFYPIGVSVNKGAKVNADIYASVKKFWNFDKKNAKDINGYISALKDLYLHIEKNPKLLLLIDIDINLMFDVQRLKTSLYADKNPLIDFPKNATNLNFSKENPEIKKEIVLAFEKEIHDFIHYGTGKISSIISTYQFPAIKLHKESDSYGFMHDNVQSRSFILPMKASVQMIRSI